MTDFNREEGGNCCALPISAESPKPAVKIPQRDNSPRCGEVALCLLAYLRCRRNSLIRRFLTLVALFIGTGLALYLLATAGPPHAPSHPPEEHEDPSLSRAATGARTLRNAAAYDGFSLQQLLGMPDGSFCYSYRVQNRPFRGMVVQHAVLPKRASELDRSDAAWHHYCAKKTGADLTENVQRLLGD